MARRKNSKKPTRKAKMSKQAAADYKAFYAPIPRKRIPTSVDYLPINTIGEYVLYCAIIIFLKESFYIRAINIYISLLISYTKQHQNDAPVARKNSTMQSCS